MPRWPYQFRIGDFVRVLAEGQAVPKGAVLRITQVHDNREGADLLFNTWASLSKEIRFYQGVLFAGVHSLGAPEVWVPEDVLRLAVPPDPKIGCDTFRCEHTVLARSHEDAERAAKEKQR